VIQQSTESDYTANVEHLRMYHFCPTRYMYNIEAAAAAWAMEAKVKALRWNKKEGLLRRLSYNVLFEHNQFLRLRSELDSGG
jgi:hypothetical protein